MRLFEVWECTNCPNVNYLPGEWGEAGKHMCIVMTNKPITSPLTIPDWCPLAEDKFGIPEGTVLSLSEDRVISLYDKDGSRTGKISFGEKNITFSGEIDKSANTLFSLVKYVVDGFTKDRK